jgi:hypothetical protein
MIFLFLSLFRLFTMNNICDFVLHSAQLQEAARKQTFYMVQMNR